MDIEKIKALSLKISLDLSKDFLNASKAVLSEICNGCGAEWMSKKSRAILDSISSSMECSVAIHDWDYHHSDGSKEGQIIADNRFFENAKKEIYYKYKFCLLGRCWNLYKLRIAYKVLQRLGEPAWCVAFRNNQIKNQQINKI